MDSAIIRRHSSATGASPIRGHLTVVPGMAVRPAAVSSSKPGANGTAQTFMASTRASLTMFTVNSWLSWILRVVSLGLWSP
jgi:hypothetical protein